MGNIQLINLFIFLLQLFFNLIFCNGPPQQPEIIPLPLQCYGRCLAKCSNENLKKSLNQCRKECRKYGQQGLCAKEDLECWGRCKDLILKKSEGPPLSPPTEMLIGSRELVQKEKKIPIYMIRLQAEFPERKSAQIFSRGLSHSGMAFPTAENVCGPVNIRLAAVNAEKGWPFGIDDLEVIPIFHLLSCAEPDLNQAMPMPEFIVILLLIHIKYPM
ncbi:hypothetical protein Mgra_00007705, partial [Meloidogyne graminicola]